MKQTKIDYQPLNGFFNLRNFDLTSKEFKNCWRNNANRKHAFWESK